MVPGEEAMDQVEEATAQVEGVQVEEVEGSAEATLAEGVVMRGWSLAGALLAEGDSVLVSRGW